MIDIEIIASFLLVFRLLSVFFISVVIKRQFELFKQPIRQEVKVFRRVLFFLAVAVLIGNVIPIVVDAVALVADTPRPTSLSPLSVLYATSNALTSLFSSLLVWLLYKIANDSNKR